MKYLWRETLQLTALTATQFIALMKKVQYTIFEFTEIVFYIWRINFMKMMKMYTFQATVMRYLMKHFM